MMEFTITRPEKLIFLIGISILFAYGESLVSPPYSHCLGIRKARQFHLTLFLPFARFNNPQGVATAKMISRDDKKSEDDDDEVVVYGVNSGKHQLIYNTSMMGLDAYGKYGSGKGQFRSPTGVACDEYGNVYVVDAGNNRVVHLFNPQKKVQWVKTFTGGKKGKGGLKSPSQVGLDAQGRVYVTDSGSRRIVVFDSTGAVSLTIPRKQNTLFVNGPTTIAIADGASRWTYGKYRMDRFIFCADSGGKRLWKIDFSGDVLSVKYLPKRFAAHYGAIDYYHNFWITDTKNHCVLKYDRNLKLLDVFGSFGKKEYQFIEPRGIAIWKRYGQTFIAEKIGAQYYWVGTDLKKMSLKIEPSPDIGKRKYTITTNLTEPSFITLSQGNSTDTSTLLYKHLSFPGNESHIFHKEKIFNVPKGDFIFRIEPTYSSYTYYHWDYQVAMQKNGSYGIVENVKKGTLVKKKGKKSSKEELKKLKAKEKQLWRLLQKK